MPKILPDCDAVLRECIHNPGAYGLCPAVSKLPLQVTKQVLCQYSGRRQSSSEKLIKSVIYTTNRGVRSTRYMSSHCRHLRTRMAVAGAKPLIAEGCRAVAEGRQAGQRASGQNNIFFRRKVKPNASCGKKPAHDRREIIDGTKSRARSWVRMRRFRNSILHCVLSPFFDITSIFAPHLY